MDFHSSDDMQPQECTCILVVELEEVHYLPRSLEPQEEEGEAGSIDSKLERINIGPCHKK